MAVDSGTYTPETIARRLKIAEAMLGDAPPVQHWAQGLNELAKGYVGGNIYKGAEDAERTGQAGQYAAIAALLGGGGAGSAPGGASPGVPAAPGPAAAGPAPVTAAPPAAPPAGPATGSAFGGLPGWAPGERPLGMSGPTPSTDPGSLDAQRPPAAAIAAALQRPAGGPMPPSGGAPTGPPMTAPAAGSAAGGQQGDTRAKIAEMLQSPNPYVRKLGAQLAQGAISKMVTGPEWTPVAGPDGGLMQRSSTGELKAHPLASEFVVEKFPNGTLVAVNKRDPTQRHVIQPAGLQESIVRFEGDKKRAETIGEVRGKSEANLPATLEKASFALDTLNKLEAHPGLSEGTGLTGIPRRKVPGTGAYDFNAVLEQTKGQAFLDAYEALRGAGAITDAEGKAATAAKARLDAAQSEPAFREALKDYRAVIQSGLNRVRLMSGKPAAEIQGLSDQLGPNVGAPPAAAGTVRKFNPATGKIE